jgi:RNA polymerase sigma-70 factor (ECF subfamily)
VVLTALERRTDAELLASAATGPGAGEAFAAFYARHEARVVGYLRRRVPRADLAADLAAETFAAALEGAGRFDPELSRDGEATGWLLAIAHHRLLASIRRGRVAQDARRRLALERVDELASVPEELDALLAALPEGTRAAIVARVVDERPYEEIAADLRCSEMVARQRVSRGLARLRRQLSRETTT